MCVFVVCILLINIQRVFSAVMMLAFINGELSVPSFLPRLFF